MRFCAWKVVMLTPCPTMRLQLHLNRQEIWKTGIALVVNLISEILQAHGM